MHKGINSLSTFLFFLMTPCFFATPAFSEEISDAAKQAGQDACQNHRNANDPKDPCNDADLKDTASKAEYVSTTVYAAAGVTCAVGCGNAYMAGLCPGATMAGGATDTVGTALISKKAESLVSLFPIPTMPSTQIKPEDAIGKGTDEEKKAAKEQNEKNSKSSACTAAVVNGGKAGLKGYQAKQTGDSADKARQTKLQMLGQTNQLTLTGGGATSGTNPGSGDSGKGASAISMGKLTGADIISQAMTSGGGEALRRFEQLSGKPATALADKILSGENPMAAAVELASDKLGAEATTAGLQIAAVSQQLADALRETPEFASAEKAAQDSSFGSNAKASAPSGGEENSMGDLAGLMANLMPQQPGVKEQRPSSAQGVGFRKPGVAQVTSDGFHLASRSLFEIVGMRYQLVAHRFLEGGGIVNTKNSTGFVPNNPYLRK